MGKAISNKVIVVGGGIAGISAGLRLKKSGVDAVVLEAEAQPGGRMVSRKFGDTWIDCGGEWFSTTYTDFLQTLKQTPMADQMQMISKGRGKAPPSKKRLS